jgi:hypothetical protein
MAVLPKYEGGCGPPSSEPPHALDEVSRFSTSNILTDSSSGVITPFAKSSQATTTLREQEIAEREAR